MIPRLFFIAPSLVLSLLMVGCSEYPEACWPDIRCTLNCARENIDNDTCEKICLHNPIPYESTVPPPGFEGPDLTDYGMNPSNNQ